MAQISERSRATRSPAVAAIPADRFGAPGYDRRLSDKILAAFNHAYASGAVKTAQHLKSVLADVEGQERAEHNRRSLGAVDRADLWVTFVEARNRYNALSDGKTAAPARIDAAMEEMKDAYRAWSDAT
jgi:hypothetical protein